MESLREYLAAGGRMIYFAEVYGEPGPELRKLFAEYGVGFDPGVVADAQFNGGSPYLIVSLFFGEHEISRLLRQRQLNIELPTARGLTVLGEGLAPGVRVESVLRTSPYGWEESTPDENPAPARASARGRFPSSPPARARRRTPRTSAPTSRGSWWWATRSCSSTPTGATRATATW
ncbi:hypothetical protein ACN28S_35400 [Cystobacter fuscus]